MLQWQAKTQPLAVVFLVVVKKMSSRAGAWSARQGGKLCPQTQVDITCKAIIFLYLV
jgi:hypothetical protein